MAPARFSFGKEERCRVGRFRFLVRAKAGVSPQQQPLPLRGHLLSKQKHFLTAFPANAPYLLSFSSIRSSSVLCTTAQITPAFTKRYGRHRDKDVSVCTMFVITRAHGSLDGKPNFGKTYLLGFFCVLLFPACDSCNVEQACCTPG